MRGLKIKGDIMLAKELMPDMHPWAFPLNSNIIGQTNHKDETEKEREISLHIFRTSLENKLTCSLNPTCFDTMLRNCIKKLPSLIIKLKALYLTRNLRKRAYTWGRKYRKSREASNSIRYLQILTIHGTSWIWQIDIYEIHKQGI